jgi:hypothetical protein
VFINDEEVDRSDNNDGFFMTSFNDYKSRGLSWYLNQYDLEDGDQIRVEVETKVPDAGKEEFLTFETLYYVDSSAEVAEISHPKVGMRGYPLIKGRVVELYHNTEEDRRRQEIDNCLNEGF